MNLLDYTIETGFLPQLKCESLTEVVADLVAPLAAAGEAANPDALVAEVMRRELEGSTAVGGGLVIPHARMLQVSSLRIVLGTIATPLDLAAGDKRAVDVAILLVGPLGDSRQMLRVLARLARLVKDAQFLDTLRVAQSSGILRDAFALGSQ
ncbi:MAG: PTS system nitrogen regulatory IIA component [Candidatus Krumholzibacteriia bacterium]|jgi:PTS system nitrogen regulatory IIA component